MAHVLPFSAIRAEHLPLVGGKGANLGEMSAAGLPVPGGFCLTTEAYAAIVAATPGAAEAIAALDSLDPGDVAGAREAGAALRARIEAEPLPTPVAEALEQAWRAEGAEHAYAVRSSATAEDLPGASFAGQQDTLLNVRGLDALLHAARACVASLFTERAILYRARAGFSHAQVALAVVVQRMVLPEISGILFTADPVSGHRGVVSIDAGWGLGEALVSGVISADHYRVRRADGRLLESRFGEQDFSIEPLPEGGTERVPLPAARRGQRVCDDALLAELVALGERVEAHYGEPQDIEWCADAEGLHLVQSRPITSLYPLPAPAPTDGTLRAYVSFGHLQVMTDVGSVMGRSVWRTLMPFGREKGDLQLTPWFAEAGGRIFIDVTPALLFPPSRAMLRRVMGHAEALTAAALEELLERGELQRRSSAIALRPGPTLRFMAPLLARALRNALWADPAENRRHLLERLEAVRADAQRRLEAAAPGAPRVHEARRILSSVFFEAMQLIPIPASGLVSEALATRMLRGRVSSEDLASLGRGLEGNITTEMDLQVGDLADVARRSPALVEALRAGEQDRAALRAVAGGGDFVDALEAFLERFGMRGPGEIDMGRPRWNDDPAQLLQVVVGNLSRDEGAHRAHHQAQTAAAEEALPRLLAAVGPLRRPLLRRLIQVTRGLMALREHPKFMIIRILGLVREVMLDGGRTLVERGALRAPEQVFLLSMEELEQALRSTPPDLQETLRRRAEEQARFAELRPPRVSTSEGEQIVASHSGEGFPEGALVGSSASAGVIEGLARVITDPAREVIHAGEILVAPFTDPGWTPLFINAVGLVMEVGGVMTHGSVVAREYGIPAVVCVPDCTTRIRSGDRLRVDGDRGYVEILERSEA
ncbi:MAG: phosphoenolpyruvate synthase [Alphaproteobacteria bacterium]|nr:phosphoenolpyruvate synthase [Alphaproteobacteria bacterium]MCB9792002.1 phosphoenolpyruvate synthase [Alphaproteobacteria bacterium]